MHFMKTTISSTTLVAAILIAACATWQCGGGNSTGPSVGVTTPTATVSSLSVNPASVSAGSSSQGTVTLSTAPSAAATVSLSSNNAAATVPGSVTVNSGSTTGSFSIATNSVTAATPVSITASLNNSSQSATLTVNPPAAPPPPALSASFRVVSLSQAFRKTNVPILPAGTVDACPLVGNNQTIDCVFDGSASVPPGSIREYVWTYAVGPRNRMETSTTPQHQPTESTCPFFNNGTLPGTNAGGLQFIQMQVGLQVRDASGTLSAPVLNQNVRIFPNGACGYGF